MPTLANHDAALRALGCIVTGYRGNVHLHHCHGGSMRELGEGPGMAQKNSEWLKIPLAAWLHTGECGIDSGMGVETWEATFGRQVDLLRGVSERLGYDVFELAGVPNPMARL